MIRIIPYLLNISSTSAKLAQNINYFKKMRDLNRYFINKRFLSTGERLVILFILVMKSKQKSILCIFSEMAQIIDGKCISQQIQQELKIEIDLWVKSGNRPPQLTAILIGDDPASETYVNNKMKASRDVGINSETIKLPSNTTEKELIQLIEELNRNNSVDAILVQLPVPPEINERNVR